ncbi:glycoside hydrolase family 25 protein [Desulfotruncus alcoholivorax]|uniref:glycoside hydrolase family 25 protein n=1 Tax=Desulfotruncus alcoholivorax TaxID=265477 RepID=UPI00040FA89E|nr:glycoside hydrolase family 25 protein [Desulfotruncus alcoholivorax]
MQLGNPNNLKGIDVSHWQGDIKWNLVKNDGFSFAYIKSTEGVDYIDPKFSTNIKEAKKAGLFVGAYHFCTPSSLKDAKDEAMHFTNVIRKHGGFDQLDLPPVIDIEKNQGLNKKQISEIVETWVYTVKEETQKQPIIYSYTYFIRDFLDKKLNIIPLWLAHYDQKQLPFSLPWQSWVFLQFTDKGKVNGINGNVDLNQFNGGIKELELICRK